MKNNEKIKKIYNKKLSILNDNMHFSNLNNSFQVGNNKLKLKYSFIEKVNLTNFKKSIISKITQLQINQQKTNLKLTSLISILLSKLIGDQKYTIFNTSFSIIKAKNNEGNKADEMKQYIDSHLNTESNKDKNKTEKENEKNDNKTKNKNNVRKIGTISLETELEIRRYTLSNQKTKTKEQFFKNKEKKEKNKKLEENKDINFYNNLFKININEDNNIIENKRNDYYYNSLNKNSSSENIKISKNIFDNQSSNKNRINFNEINYKNANKNYYSGGVNEVNKIMFSENNENRRIYINALNIHNNSSHSINNIKSNISESKSTKGPVKIKLNKTEKPVLLININENNSDKNNNSNHYTNIIDYSNYSNDNNLSSKEENEANTISKNNTLDVNNVNINNDEFKLRRKFSESKNDEIVNFSDLSDDKRKNSYSRKIRGFNFRNNIKYNNKEHNTEDNFSKIRGGSVRYESAFSHINSIN